ncbi:MAG: hypothetical protein QOI11_1299 [Candidatus Eremiobacteraeota bacterium]|nr:hypothetical protein [Candidatus Eremiobacteraeota bacterium]
MSSRKEQKERLREERLAREAEAKAGERRRRMLGFGVGGALAAAAIVAVVVAIAAGGGGGGGGKKPNAPPKHGVAIPKQTQTDLTAAAKAAGCTVRSFTPGANDRTHTESRVSYKQNPPVFGPHNPVWAADGDYVDQGAPPTEKLVHPLEHGRVVIWYKPTLPRREISQLETLFSEPMSGKPEGYKQILVERPSLPGDVAASAWGQQLICPKFGDKVFDALRDFRAAYVDKGPESVPFPE